MALTKFCRFTTIIYIPHFLAVSEGCDFTVNVITLYKQLFAYRSIDQQLADEALVLFRRHGWYLTPDVAVFSLFSRKVSLEEKSRVACRLLTFQAEAPQVFKLEKPSFPIIEERTELVDLMSPISFKFLRILNNYSVWLTKRPEEWETVAPGKQYVML